MLRRRANRGVSAVISTILMVAVTVVLAAILYTMVSGMGLPSQPKPPTAQFQGGAWGGNTSVAHYSVSFNSVQDVAGISPSTLHYVVAKADNTPCYTGVANLNQSLCPGFTVSVRYLDTTVNGSISPGDSLLVTVTPASGHPLLLGKFTVQTGDDKVLGILTMS